MLNEKLTKEYFAELGTAVNHVLSLKPFENMRGSCIKADTKHTTYPVFDTVAYKKAMKENSEYSCVGALPWINEMWTPLPGVPFNMSMAKRLADDNYSTPQASAADDDTFTVAAESKTWNPMSHLGALKLAGPSEVLHAMWMAAYRDLKDVAANGHDELACRWAARFRRIKIVFKLLTSDMEIHCAIENKREKMVSEGAAVKTTGLQKVMKVVHFKERWEATNKDNKELSAKELYEVMTTNIKFSSFSEAVTENYVNQAIDIYDKALSNSTIFDIVAGCESSPAC